MDKFDKFLITLLIISILISAYGMFRSSQEHAHDNELQAQCEARGGMFIHTGKQNQHACVGRPST